MSDFLKNINNPKDIKKLTIKELPLLSDEICQHIHDVVSEIGGHYSSPLGVVDLTVALNYVYKMPEDKIIWDVGHQAYAHKIISGRRDEFKTLRQKNGISGFLKIDESEYDAFGAGHASTSISAALGFAHARDKQKSNNKIVAIIGDGALTGGLAYEGLNNLGYHKTQLTVILNDNSLSISKSVGAVSRYLTRITTNPTYNKLRKDIWNMSGKIPTFSKQIQNIIKKTEGSIKAYLTPGSLFEELGLRYIGPVDGHDIDEMIKVLKAVRKMNTPVLLHVYTDKSKKIKQDESDAIKYYSLSGRNLIKNDDSRISYSKVLGESLFHLADSFSFHCITAAMEIGTGLTKYSDSYSSRYIDVGIAEGHAVTYSAGLSASNILPVIPIYSTFMQRAYDNIIHDFALQSLPGIFCMDRSGVVGNDGPTHHGVFDISFMRTIPGMIVSAPKDGNELYDLLYTGIKNKLLLSIRYPKELTDFDCSLKPKEIIVGSWEYLNKGKNICILATGSMVKECVKAVQMFNDINITLINCRFIKPIDTKLLDELTLEHSIFYTFEEGIINGGFGSAILEYFKKKHINSNLFIHGIDDQFTEHASRNELLKELKLDAKSIYELINKNNYVKK